MDTPRSRQLSLSSSMIIVALFGIDFAALSWCFRHPTAAVSKTPFPGFLLLGMLVILIALVGRGTRLRFAEFMVEVAIFGFLAGLILSIQR